MVAVSRVEFRGRTTAREFQDLSDTYGTGYVRPMGGAVLDMADVRLTGQHYDSGLSGAVAVTAEAEPLTGQFDDEVAIWSPRR